MQLIDNKNKKENNLVKLCFEIIFLANCLKVESIEKCIISSVSILHGCFEKKKTTHKWRERKRIYLALF